MRVITGTARGRKLKTPESYDIRPTTGNVKESIFNIIQFDIEGRRVLDLFAGTGQLGIECLSRGAESAVFVDQSREAVKIIKENLISCDLKGTVIETNSVSFLKSCGKFDIIFIDPPYDSDLYEVVLDNIIIFDILRDGGIIICECHRGREMPEMKEPYRKVKEYNYGTVKLCKYIKEF